MNINIEMLKNDIVEINIIYINFHNYRYLTEDIEGIKEFKKSIRVLFNDGSYVDFYLKHIIAIEYNTEEGINGQ